MTHCRILLTSPAGVDESRTPLLLAVELALVVAVVLVVVVVKAGLDACAFRACLARLRASRADIRWPLAALVVVVVEEVALAAEALGGVISLASSLDGLWCDNEGILPPLLLALPISGPPDPKLIPMFSSSGSSYCSKESQLLCIYHKL
jgi:hypothetical protein